jgi:hypothetical protein
MLRKALVVTALFALLASPAFAQARVEASGFLGWTFSDGVSFTGTPINGSIYTRADPKDAMSYGFTFGGYVNEQFEVEFLWSRQASTLEVTGSGPTLSGDMNVDNYHGNFVYNMGDRDTVLRPFVFVGLGATNFGDAKFPTKTVPGMTKFSWALGGGIKAFPTPHVGFKGMIRWTPTYIKTDGYGWWCDPFWGCAPIGDAQYSNQFEFTAGLVARF